MRDNNGLDMSRTIEFYERNKESLLARLPNYKGNALSYSVANKELISLSYEQIQAVIDSFPEEARNRMLPYTIMGRNKSWFHKIPKKNGYPRATKDITQRVSDMAIIPLYISYAPWGRTGKPSAVVALYDLEDTISPEARRIILTEGLAHELGHALVIPELFLPERNLILSDGREVIGKEFVNGFKDIAEKYGPISTYSSSFWKDGKVNNLNEELAENIAAGLLGFASCGNEQRGLNPFADRPEIKARIEQFLNAGVK